VERGSHRSVLDQALVLDHGRLSGVPLTDSPVVALAAELLSVIHLTQRQLLMALPSQKKAVSELR
jgi:hypothetical protein